MDKSLTKKILKTENVPTVKDVWFTKDDWEMNKDGLKEKIKTLSLPLFVKPVHLGSSIAITKVDDESKLEEAIEVALHFDDKVLVEEGVPNLIEVTLPILGNEKPKLGAIEKALNKSDFFDFEEKYMNSGKGQKGANNAYSELPAKIEASLAEKVKELALKTYRILGCSGTARVDFLINSETEEVYVNEVNTLPGSLYHHNWKAVGVSSSELIDQLIALALEHFLKKKNITHTFASGILNKASGPKLDN